VDQLMIGEEFPDLSFLNTDGPFKLRDRWRNGPLVVAFMRHFG
jgi:hypothetical protein